MLYSLFTTRVLGSPGRVGAAAAGCAAAAPGRARHPGDRQRFDVDDQLQNSSSLIWPWKLGMTSGL